MSGEDYEDIWDLVRSSGVKISREKFDSLVEDLYSKARSMLNRRAAAMIIARNLGVDVFQIAYPPIIGRILEVGPVKISRGKEGEVPYVMFTLVNESDLFTCVAFGDHHIRVIRENEDRVVRVRKYLRTKLRKYEIIKVTENSIVEPLSDDLLPPVTELKPALARSLRELKDSGRTMVAKFYVIAEERTYREICPICGRMLEIQGEEWVCPEHGVVEPDRLSILRLIISDASGTFPAVSFVEPPVESLQDRVVVAKGYFKGDELQIRKFYKIEEGPSFAAS